MSRWTMINLPGSCSFFPGVVFFSCCSIASDTEGERCFTVSPRTEPAIVVNWQQFTKHAETLKPMHAENGQLGRNKWRTTESVDAWNDWKDRPEQNVLRMENTNLWDSFWPWLMCNFVSQCSVSGRYEARFQYLRFLKILPKPDEGDVKKAELMLSHPFSVNESLAGLQIKRVGRGWSGLKSNRAWIHVLFRDNST